MPARQLVPADGDPFEHLADVATAMDPAVLEDFASSLDEGDFVLLEQELDDRPQPLHLGAGGAGSRARAALKR